jgi:hypothetical protein
MLYIALIPVIAVVGALGAMSILRSEGSGGTAPSASATPVASAYEAAQERSRALRRQYRECMETLGGNYRQPRMRGRFSRATRPDMSKLREAAATCQSLLEHGAGETPVSKPSAPPVL